MNTAATIVDPAILRLAETRFVDAVRDHLDWPAVQAAVRRHLNAEVRENLNFIQGALTVCDGEPAIRFDYHLEIRFSVFIGLNGALLHVAEAEGQGRKEAQPSPETYLTPASRAETLDLAADIARLAGILNGATIQKSEDNVSFSP